MKNANQPAFPEVNSEIIKIGGEDALNTVTNGGLTKREYFAAMAMQGFINTNMVREETMHSKIQRLLGLDGWKVKNSYSYSNIVKSSVELADKLLAELEKSKP